MKEGKQMLQYSYNSDQQRHRGQWRTLTTSSFNGSSFYNNQLDRLRYFFGDFEINAEIGGSTGVVNADYIHYVRGIDGKIVSIINVPFSLDVSKAINTTVVNPAQPVMTTFEINGKTYYIWSTSVRYEEDDLGNIFNPKNFPVPFSPNYTYVYTDHIGSMLTFTDQFATVIHEQNFDAWGRYRDPNSLSYIRTAGAPSFIYRGYTEHEHLDDFELINMNGRVYDPILGRFLSTDASINDPSNPQSYNRYTYCLNNPLKYTDPSGEVSVGSGSFNPVASFAIGVTAYGLYALLNDKPFTLIGALNSGVVYTVNAFVTSLIGDFVAGSTIPVALKPFTQLMLHGSYNGLMAEIKGGRFIDGFTSAITASMIAGFSAPILSATGIRPSSILGQSIGFVTGFSTGFVIDKYFNNGNGWDGAIISATIFAFNHFPHFDGFSPEDKPLQKAEKHVNGVTDMIEVAGTASKDLVRKTTYELSKISKVKPGKLYQNTKKALGFSSKLTKFGGPLGSGISLLDIGSEIHSGNVNAHTYVNGGLIIATGVGFAFSSPAILTGIAIYGVGDYFFDFSGQIDSKFGK